MNKSYKGIRKYKDSDGFEVFDIIIIRWNKNSEWYEIETYDCIPSMEVKGINPDILGQWAKDLSAAKKKALMDTGLKSSDFEWEEI
jgi:hypothetical protein